jgi:CheY-specific phosphatase CheX
MDADDALQKKYAIAPMPESVARLGRLVAKRLDDTEAIAQVINSDAALKRRLLLAANRGDPNGDIDTVDGAIMRTGIESVLVLAMTEPLSRAVVRTFSTMLNMELAPADPASVSAFTGTCFVSAADFTGRATGMVHLRLRESLARAAAGLILGENPAQLPLETVCDVIGELTNMIAGNFQSNLCDASLTCRLSTPSVQSAASFILPKAAPGRRQEMVFMHEQDSLFVAVTVHSLE